MIRLALAFQLLAPEEIARLHEERIARQPDNQAAKRDLGLFWLRNGRGAEAEKWLRAGGGETLFVAEAVAAQRRHGEAEALFGECRENPRCLTRLGQYAEQREEWDRAIALYAEAVAKEPTPARRNDLGQALQSAKRWKEAEAEFRAALGDAELRFGSNHPETATTLNNLAHLLAESGRPKLAIPLQRRAVSIFEKTLGPRHERTRIAADNLKDLLP